MNEQARRHIPPNRVRHPADRQFASGCSPPRLTTTQLPSATRSWLASTRTCTVLIRRLHRRTHSGLDPESIFIVPVNPGFPASLSAMPWLSRTSSFLFGRTSRLRFQLGRGSQGRPRFSLAGHSGFACSYAVALRDVLVSLWLDIPASLSARLWLSGDVLSFLFGRTSRLRFQLRRGFQRRPTGPAPA